MSIHIIGDLHGYHEEYIGLLQRHGLCDGNLSWTGGSDELWLIGDLFDRGSSGIRCLDVTMHLQEQAAAAGGRVQCLLGNHEMMILCAWRFGDERTRDGIKVTDLWRYWGGQDADLDGLTGEHVTWLEQLPAMALREDNLLIHADSMVYVQFGTSIEAVNDRFRHLLQSCDLREWESALSAFSEHQAFSGLALTGKRRASQILGIFGGKRIIHGHTPIPHAAGCPASEVNRHYEYAGGQCINVDGGLYMGSPGFVLTLD